MCCPGCRAVAVLIAQSGLESYYDKRSALAPRPANATPISESAFTIYDDPEVAASFTAAGDTGKLSAKILIGGIHCAACTWLIEQSLGALPGVDSAVVNLQQSTLSVSVDPAQCPLSSIFTQLQSLGYSPQPFRLSVARDRMTQEQRADLRRLAVAGLGMMQVGMLAIALHAGDVQGMDTNYQSLLRWAGLPVAVFVVLYSAHPFFITAWRHLRQGGLVMDLPVALAIGLALIASVWATVTGTGQVYFDSIVMFTFFLLLGRFFERRARHRHQFSWLDVSAQLPDRVLVRRGSDWQPLAREQLRRDDQILIKPGEVIPTDAHVVSGSSSVSEETFNGEALPRTVDVGATIFGGTLNVEQGLEARVLGPFENTRLAAVQASLEEAHLRKPRLAQLADHIAGYFVAGVLLLAAVTALIWWQIDASRALWVTLSVLVVSCPCALALATPVALSTAANALRRNGVIVRGENALDALAKTTHLLFDKTGTLTLAQLRVEKIVPLQSAFANQNEQLLALCHALQQQSTHPVAHAFQDIASTVVASALQQVAGAGIEGVIDGQRYRIGSMSFCRAIAPQLPTTPTEPLYWVALCREGEALAWIGLVDSLREEAPEVVRAAREMGLDLALLTGDPSMQGPRAAEQVGISRVYTDQTPEQKMQYVTALQADGNIVAMVGDGLNDAPVLGVANASFAVAGATGLAQAQADFVLVEGDLRQLLYTFDVAQRTRRIIVQNFTWALAYNICMIPLAMLGLVPPWGAAIGMSLSSLIVLGNSLRLNRTPRAIIRG